MGREREGFLRVAALKRDLDDYRRQLDRLIFDTKEHQDEKQSLQESIRDVLTTLIFLSSSTCPPPLYFLFVLSDRPSLNFLHFSLRCRLFIPPQFSAFLLFGASLPHRRLRLLLHNPPLLRIPSPQSSFHGFSSLVPQQVGPLYYSLYLRTHLHTYIDIRIHGY